MRGYTTGDGAAFGSGAGAGSPFVFRARFQMCELRRDGFPNFGGGYRHTLVRDAGGALKIRLQRVDLFNGQASFDYVLQIWV